MLVSNKAKVLLLAFCLAFASICQAIGFGALKVYSYLGEPLYAEIELTGYEGFDVGLMQVGLADAKAFVRAGIERPYFLTSLVFQIVNYNEAVYVVVRTSKPVKSPFLEFLIELSWPGGDLIKEYTILLDPPPSDLSKESRPKSAADLAAEKNAGTNENAIQQQLIQQIAQQQKAAAQESLKSVVKEGDNKFSDQTFDTKEQKAQAPGLQATPEETAAKTQDYQTKREEYLRKSADQQSKYMGASALQTAGLSVSELKSEVKPDLTVEQILADEHKAHANADKTTPPTAGTTTPTTPTTPTTSTTHQTPTGKETPAEDVTFKNVIKPAGNKPAGAAQRLAAQTAGSTAVATAPQTGAAPPVAPAPAAEAPPSKGGHLYLGMILSLMLIGAGIAIALKRGMLPSTFTKHSTSAPTEEHDPLDEFADVQQTSTSSYAAATAQPVSEDVPMSDNPNEALLDAAMTEFVRPEEQDVEQIELTAMPVTPPPAPAAAAPTSEAAAPIATSPGAAKPASQDPVDATLDQIEQEFENINLDELAPPVTEPEATPPKEEPMQAAQVIIPTPQEIQSTPEEPIIPEPVPSIEPVNPPMSPPPEDPGQEPFEVPQTPATPEQPPETAGPQLGAENESLVVAKEEAAFKGPTLTPDQGSTLKLSEEGATLSMGREENGTILDNSDSMAKKISLAKQYIDTGDYEAAKELLQQVIETANDEQKLEAQLLLTSLI